MRIVNCSLYDMPFLEFFIIILLTYKYINITFYASATPKSSFADLSKKISDGPPQLYACIKSRLVVLRANAQFEPYFFERGFIVQTSMFV